MIIQKSAEEKEERIKKEDQEKWEIIFSRLSEIENNIHSED